MPSVNFGQKSSTAANSVKISVVWRCF